MTIPNYKILYQDRDSKNIVLRITNTYLEGCLLDVVLDEWPDNDDLDSKLKAEIPQLQDTNVKQDLYSNGSNEEAETL